MVDLDTGNRGSAVEEKVQNGYPWHIEPERRWDKGHHWRFTRGSIWFVSVFLLADTHRSGCISRRDRRATRTVHDVGKRVVSSRLGRQLVFQSANTSSFERQKSSRIDTGNYQIRIKTIKKEFLDKETKLQIELIDDTDQREVILLDQTTNKIANSNKDDINPKKDLGNVCELCFISTPWFISLLSSWKRSSCRWLDQNRRKKISIKQNSSK